MIDHEILLLNFKNYGVVDKWYSSFESYYVNRCQTVEINGKGSNWCKVECGVPQGSILGPLLFIIYINDLPNCCKHTEIHLFADDTNISSLGPHRSKIDSDLSDIGSWLVANKLSPNLEKTVQLNLCTSASNKSFSLNNCPISIKLICKYLGVRLDSKLSFVSHVEYVKKRLGKQCE